MRFLYPLFFYYCVMSSANGCDEIGDADFQKDKSLDVQQNMRHGECGDGNTVTVDRLLEERLGEMFRSDEEVNLEIIMENIGAILKDPKLQVIVEGMSMNKFDDDNDSDTCAEDRVIEMPSSDVGDTCGFV